LEGNTPAIGTGTWTIVSGVGGNIATPASPTSAFTGNPGEVYTLQWTISNSSCTPSSDQVQITIDANSPTVANAGPDDSACSNTITLQGNTPIVGTGQWTVQSGDLLGSFADDTDPTTDFT